MNIVPSIFKRMRSVMLLVVTMLMLSAQTARAQGGNYQLNVIANYEGNDAILSVPVAYNIINGGYYYTLNASYFEEQFNRGDGYHILGFSTSIPFTSCYASGETIELTENPTTLYALWGDVNTTYWTVSKSEGSADYDVLTISGIGAMTEYESYEDYPWHPYDRTIKTLVINEGVTTVSQCAFIAFLYLKTVSLPSTVTSIGQGAFLQCMNLTSIELPSNLINIGELAFYSCRKLTSIDIPASVTSIERSAFDECNSLSSVIVHSTTPPSLGWYVFNNNASGRKIYVPSTALNNYKSATNWRDYAADIIGTGQTYTVTTISNPNSGGTVQVRTDNNTEWAASVNASQNDKVYFKITAASGYSINGTPNIAPNAGMSITPTYPGSGADPYFTMPADDVTITANFLSSGIVSSYCTMSFNANGGTGSMTNIKQQNGSSVTIPDCGFTRSDYTFIGWAISANGEVVYSPGQTITFTNSLTLYAKWFEGYIGTCGKVDPTEGLDGTEVTWSLTKGEGSTHLDLLTISGSGAMEDYESVNATPWREYRETIKTVIINESVTYVGKYAFSRFTALTSITVRATTPPTLDVTAFSDNADGRKILVPAASLTVYKSAANWSYYAADILPDYSAADWATAYAGTADDPYMIYTPSQLLLLAHRVNGTNGETVNTYENKYFKLGADIAFSHVVIEGSDYAENFEAIGGYHDGYRTFMGNFDGDGHTVSGIRLRKTGRHTDNSYQALFGRISSGANIHDVHLTDARIKGFDYVGGIVGYNDNGTVSRCVVTDTHITGTDQSSGGSYGAICGYNTGGTLTNNYYHGCTIFNVNETFNAGCDRTDITENDGAVPVYLITLADANITASGTTAVSLGGNNYHTSGTTVTLGHGEREGYTFSGYTVKDADNNDITVTEDNGVYSLVMPARDITISASWIENMVILIGTGNTGITTMLTNLNGKVADVTLTRTFPAGKKQTVCLPFNPSELLSLGKVWKFTGISGGKAVMTEIESTSTLQANTPYIFAATNEVTVITFNNVAINIGTEPKTVNGTAGFTFHGTYEQKVWEASSDEVQNGTIYGFMMSDNDGQAAGQFVKARRRTVLRPFSCWLEYNGELSGTQTSQAPLRSATGSDASSAASELPDVIEILWVGADGTTETTGVIDTRTGTLYDDDAWYDLFGRKLNGEPTKPGLYINNGKKVHM